jgi:hypothetical protein
MSSPVRTSPRRPPRRPATSDAALASMGRRVAGAAIDMVLLVFISGVVASFLERATAGVTRVRIDAVTGERVVNAAIDLPPWLPLLLLVLLTAAYSIPLMALFGRTLGGWAMGIQCVREDSAGRLGWSLSARRWFLLYGAAGVLAFVPGIGPFSWILILLVGLSPLWDATRRLRGYADHAAQDIVVMAKASATR